MSGLLPRMSSLSAVHQVIVSCWMNSISLFTCLMEFLQRCQGPIKGICNLCEARRNNNLLIMHYVANGWIYVETLLRSFSVFEWWDLCGLIRSYLARRSSSLGGYDKSRGGYISLRASNGSLKADSQDLICVYLQPGRQKKGTFLGVWS